MSLQPVKKRKNMSFLNKIQGSIEKIYPEKHQLDILCGAFGFTLFVPGAQLYQTGQNMTFMTHLIWREDQQMIFGFSSIEQREAFLNLIKVRTLGPKIALNILSSNFQQFLKACSEQDKALLTKIPGVGPKMAVKILQQFEGDNLLITHGEKNADFDGRVDVSRVLSSSASSGRGYQVDG